MEEFKDFLRNVKLIVGHNVLSFDLPILFSVGGVCYAGKVIDTLIVSRLLNYGISGGHSLEAWGTRLKIPKVGVEISDWSQYTPLMRERCLSDTKINLALLRYFEKYILDPRWERALETEHELQKLCNELHNNGFPFDLEKANDLHTALSDRLNALDHSLLTAFPPRLKLQKEVHPKLTRNGTLNRSDFRFSPNLDLSHYTGGPFSLIEIEEFNPGSVRQIVERLNEAGWRPTEKTKGHVGATRRGSKVSKEKLEHFKKFGWKVSDQNLVTLPETNDLEEWINNCRIKIQQKENNGIDKIILNILRENAAKQENATTPIKITLETSNLKEISELVYKTTINFLVSKEDVAKFVSVLKTSFPEILLAIIVTTQGVYVDCSAISATGILDGIRGTEIQQKHISKLKAAKSLAQRILIASRVSDLDEWIALCASGMINGTFQSIGAWTHRMAHQKPNMGNIPVAKRKKEETEFETFVNDTNDRMRALWIARPGYRLIGIDATGIQMRILAHYANSEALTQKLTSGEDIHEFHVSALGKICRGRDPSKRFLYAWILGAGVSKVAEILECSLSEAKVAIDNFLGFYPALAELKKTQIPGDVSRGYFTGLDGRLVAVPPETKTGRDYLLMSGYLQNGEKIVMARAFVHANKVLKSKNIPFFWRNIVHDEIQVEVRDDDTEAGLVASVVVDSIVRQSVDLNLNCPLAANPKYGYSWKETH